MPSRDQAVWIPGTIDGSEERRWQATPGAAAQAAAAAGVPRRWWQGAASAAWSPRSALHRAGLDVEVFEAAQEMRALGRRHQPAAEFGAGAKELGLQPALARTAIETAELIYVNKFGQRIWQEPRGVGGRLLPFRSTRFTAGELHMILYRAVLEALGPEAIHTGHVLAGFEQDEHGVTAGFTDRETGRGPVDLSRRFPGRRRRHPLRRAPGLLSGRKACRVSPVACCGAPVPRPHPYLTGRSMVVGGPCRPEVRRLPDLRGGRRPRPLPDQLDRGTAGAGRRRSRPDAAGQRLEPQGRQESVFSGPFHGWNFGWLNVPDLIARAEAVFEFPMVDRDPVAALDPWPGHAARRRGPSDVPDRLQRRIAGDPRRAGTCRAASRRRLRARRRCCATTRSAGR